MGGRRKPSRRHNAGVARPFLVSTLSPTDRFIQLTGAVDKRGKLATRNYKQPYQGQILKAEKYGTRTLDQIAWLVVHHTGDGSARPTIDDTALYQTGPNAQLAFPGLAYTGFIEKDGTIEVGWNLETVTWSQGDGSPTSINGVGIFNYEGIAFCFSGQDPTTAQLDSYRRIKAALADPGVIGRTLEVRGHRQVSGSSDTECPGDIMVGLLSTI